MSAYVRTVDSEGYRWWHGVCEYCGLESGALFRHAQDGCFYCIDVFACEERFEDAAAVPSSARATT